MGSKDLGILLVMLGFITQKVLMNKLYNLRRKYEGKVLYLKDFNVQLEKRKVGNKYCDNKKISG
jgi:hypothetical protein